MSNYPGRNWGVILQQAWSVYLKDRISKGADEPKMTTPGKRKDICKRFNRGTCTSGFHCQYDHRCLKCGKFGHGAHICRSKKANNNHGSDNNTENDSKQNHKQ